MKIRFLGTAAAEGVPAEFCNCEFCKNIRKASAKRFRTRSQVYIDGCLSVDFPPEAFAHSMMYGVNYSELKYLLVTHSHMDHFYAHDFILRGYKYAKLEAPRLEIYGNAEVNSVFNECTARELRGQVAEGINFNVIKPYDEFTAGEYRVIALPAIHNKNEACLLFYIERDGSGYLHLYDTHGVSEKALKFLAERGTQAQAVAFDCTYTDSVTDENARHMGIFDIIALREKLEELKITNGSSKYFITHFSHNGNPTDERLAEIGKKYGVIPAYDGLETEI